MKKLEIEKKPKRYFVKTKRPYEMADGFSAAKHKRCGGKPAWVDMHKGVLHCLSCRKELFFPAVGTPKVQTKSAEIFAKNFYVEEQKEINPSALEPVWKSVEIEDGRVAYSSWRKLTEKELINYYHKGSDIISE